MARTKVQTDMINFGGTEIDRRKNYIVNPGFAVSQENGNASSTADGYYFADQWQMWHSQDGTLTVERGYDAVNYYGFVTVTSADASLGATQFAQFGQTLEGLRVADLEFGLSTAKQVVLAFDWYSPAGTYAVVLRNAATDRSYVAEFAVAGGEASTWVRRTVVIPGDTSGTWPKTAVAGCSIGFSIACGSTYQTTPGAWQAGNYLGTASMSNGIGTTSATFGLRRVGLYADPDETGVAPPFVLPDYDDDLRSCQRYWESSYRYGVTVGTTTYEGARYSSKAMHTSDEYLMIDYREPKRTPTPTVTLYSPVGGASGNAYEISGSNITATAASGSEYSFVIYATITTSGRYYSVHYTANSRM